MCKMRGDLYRYVTYKTENKKSIPVHVAYANAFNYSNRNYVRHFFYDAVSCCMYLFHFLGENIVQILLSSIIGAIFCICKVKIKNCTLLSVIIAHGVYDTLITVWLNVFT